MALITRSTFTHKYVPGLFAVAVDAYDMFNDTKKVWDRICHVKTSEKQYEEKAYRSTLPALQLKGEGEAITFDTYYGGPKKRWVHKVYALGTRITEEAIDDDLYENMKDSFRDLGIAAAEHPEIMTARLINNAHATTYHTDRGGTIAISSTAHVRLDGSTFSNEATSADLTYLTFWTNIILLENQYDDVQRRVRMTCNGLIHPPQLTRKAIEILNGSERPDQANRAVNAVTNKYGKSIEDIEWPYMTDTDMWVLKGDNHDLIWFKRWNTRFAKEGDFDTGDLKCKVVRRDSVEMGDVRGFYFNIP